MTGERAAVVERRYRWLRALTVLTVIVLLGWVAVPNLRTDSSTIVTAVFADSSPLVVGNKVQLDGVEVGQISAITLVNGQAHVRMSLDAGVLPLHTDATAKIQPVSLLGERFVALGRGSPAAPVMRDPEVIPVSQTSSSVDLDDLLNTLDDPTSTALAAIVTTLGEGLADQGDTAAKAFDALPPALRQTDQLSRLLDQQNAVLNELIVSAQKNTTAFAQPLDSLVGGAQQALGAVAANRQALDEALAELPGTLTAARRTLARLGATADNTTDLLSGMRPLTDNLVDTSRELHGFADAANPALIALPDVLDRLNQMLDEARPVVEDLGPAAADLSSVSGSVHALSEQLLTHPAGAPSQLENLMSGMADWAMATTGFDGISHYYRGVIAVTPSLIGTDAGSVLPPTARPPFNPVPSDPNGKSGYPGTAPLPFLHPLPNPDGSDNSSYTDPNREPDRGGVSRLTPKQEGDMFDQLFGGGG